MPVVSAVNLERIPLHGLFVHRVTLSSALDAIDAFSTLGRPHHVVTLDASMCVMAQTDRELKTIVSNADLVTPDSAGVLWACRRKGEALEGRVSGVELVERLCAQSADRGYRLFFLGAAPGVAEVAAERMRAKYPGCSVVGTRDGFFEERDIDAVIEEVCGARPHILCVAMGIPKQEKFISKHKDSLGVPVLIGVGGTFDVLSGAVSRAPSWVQRLNLEWLHRLMKNPRKIAKVLTLPKFVWQTLRDKS